MATWTEDITLALEQLGGIAPLSEIYERVGAIRQKPHPTDLGASVRGAIERNSSDSTVFSGKDLFFSVHGISGGVWGCDHLRSPRQCLSILMQLMTKRLKGSIKKYIAFLEIPR